MSLPTRPVTGDRAATPASGAIRSNGGITARTEAMIEQIVAERLGLREGRTRTASSHDHDEDLSPRRLSHGTVVAARTRRSPPQPDSGHVDDELSSPPRIRRSASSTASAENAGPDTSAEQVRSVSAEGKRSEHHRDGPTMSHHDVAVQSPSKHRRLEQHSTDVGEARISDRHGSVPRSPPSREPQVRYPLQIKC